MAKLNINISDNLMEWLDMRAKEIHVTKTALVNLALEQYMQSHIVISQTDGIGELVKKMQAVQKALDSGALKVVKTKD